MKEFEDSAGPHAGRFVLLVTAYAPVVVIVGLRALPDAAGWITLGVGVAGVLAWALFLSWLPDRQPRTAVVDDLDFIDAEVTGYIVSILLPVVAATDPKVGDWLAYGLCAFLILAVAYAAALWSINPVTYAFRMRAARASIDGNRKVVLVMRGAGERGEKIIVSRIGVTLVLGDVESGRPR